MNRRKQLEEIARRGDQEEWLRVLLHEVARASNAEADRDRLVEYAKIVAEHHGYGDAWQKHVEDTLSPEVSEE